MTRGQRGKLGDLGVMWEELSAPLTVLVIHTPLHIIAPHFECLGDSHPIAPHFNSLGDSAHFTRKRFDVCMLALAD